MLHENLKKINKLSIGTMSAFVTLGLSSFMVASPIINAPLLITGMLSFPLLITELSTRYRY